MTDYKIIQAWNLGHLETKIREAMKEGWTLGPGGVKTMHGPGQSIHPGTALEDEGTLFFREMTWYSTGMPKETKPIERSDP